MPDNPLTEQFNRGYACPSWRAACACGWDTSQVEEALRMTSEERLEAHQRALDQLLDLQSASRAHAPGR